MAGIDLEDKKKTRVPGGQIKQSGKTMRDIDQALERIAKLGGEGLVERLIGAVRDNAAKRVAGAREALAAGDLETLGRAAHSLKSSAANVGAARLVELAKEIEERSAESRQRRAGKTADPRQLEALVGELPAALEEVDAYLKGRASDEKDRGG